MLLIFRVKYFIIKTFRNGGVRMAKNRANKEEVLSSSIVLLPKLGFENNIIDDKI